MTFNFLNFKILLRLKFIKIYEIFFKNPLFFLCLTLFLLNSFLIFNYVFSWTIPQDNPPNANLPAPINTSPVDQTKTGGLSIGGVFRVGLFSSHPTSTNGAIYYNTTDHKFYGYQNNSWSELGGGGFWLANGNDIYYNSGNVGIGTTTPTQKLTVAGNIGIQAGANAFIGTLDNYALSLKTNNQDRIYITNDGKVGIGTSTPNNLLQVYDLINFTNPYTESVFVGYQAGKNTYAGWANSAFGYSALYNNTTGYENSAFGYSALSSNTTGYGNVAMGYQAGKYLSNGSSPLSSPTYGVYIGYNAKGYSANETNAIVIGYNAVSAGSNSVVIGNDSITKTILKGNVGIGTTDPGSYKLYVSGTAYSTGGWQSSDLRYKKNILGITDPLNTISQLKGVSFEWKTDEYPQKGFPEGRHFGLIAQEVEKVLPEVVKVGPDGEKSINYSELIPFLIESIKQLKSEVKQLKSENEILKSRIEQLEK